MNICLHSSSSRLSALLRAAALAAALLAPHGARAQQGPLATSPTAPTPFSWSTFHSGGTNPTALITPLSPYLLPNPLSSQLQGTPTGVYTGTTGTFSTEIPSFLIGNYDFNQPPAGVDPNAPTNILYFPNHFADDLTPGPGGYLSWSAPFTFLAATGQTTTTQTSQGHTTIVADDSQTTATLYPVGTPNVGGVAGTPSSGVDAGWTVLWTTTVGAATANTWGATITDVTASGNPPEYRRQPAVPVAIGAKSSAAAGYQTATWTWTAPAAFTAPAAAGLYSVVFHLPDPQTPFLADGTTANPSYPERRIGDAHYVIKLNGNVVYDTDTLDKNGNIVSRAAISQTETNDPQPLAGPFALKATDVLTVTLDNTTTRPITDAAHTFVLADSVSLVPTTSLGGSARLDGSPTAINATDFPEIANALFYGFAVTRDPTTGVATGQTDDNANPYGNKTIDPAPATATATPSSVDAAHAIRQLVYFGRYEGIVLTNTAGALVDANGAVTTTPVTRMVGAIYCVDGINGDVVWRFQTSDVLNPTRTITNPNGTIAKPSAPIYTTPAIARMNVLVNGTVETKLCVVAADDNGLVYCLDAIGNRNGTDHNAPLVGAPAAVQATTDIEPLYNQPIYNPGAGVNTGGAQDLTDGHAHVGNTTAYWVYRPDAARPRVLPPATGSTATPPATKKIDPTSDLPVPAAFGLASPTIYVNPNTVIDTTLATEAPGYTGTPSTVLTANANVYIGNSNGTLYKLDATGAAVTETTPTTTTVPGSGIFYSRGEQYNYVLPISLGGYNPSQALTTPTPLPTPTTAWWFAVNKASTNDTTQSTNVAITSAPSIFQSSATTAVGATPQYIYFATSNETTNVGNVFSVQDTGPVNYSSAGATLPLTAGSTNYNLLARPDWSFPNAYTNTKTGKAVIHAALGSISGSPVVFTNPDTNNSTSVYFAADMGPEGYDSQGKPTERTAPAENGRIWSVDAATGTTQWAYPDTFDPNKDNTAVASAKTIGGNTTAADPLGTFRNATPAIGIVQFPAVIQYGTATALTNYIHTDAVNTTNVISARVPMLYVGSRTEALDSSNFFSLDLDGRNDNERNIHFIDNANNATTNIAPVGQTYGPGFESSPLLVTNPGPTAGGGNGGVVFIAGSDSTLNEISATPTTDIGAGSNSPQFTLFAQIGGFGAFASPAIAGYNDVGLQAVVAGAPQFDTDWVYGADSTLGFARGITPGNRTDTGGTVDYGTDGPGYDREHPNAVPQQFPLHVYLFDGTGTHDPKSTDMGTANKIGEAVAAFEWGQKLYIRVSNVVPPNPPTTQYLSGDPTYYMADPTDKSVYYTNGGSVQVQLSDIDATGKILPGRGADIATINTNTLTSLTDPNSNGFIKESPSGLGAQDNVGDMLTDNSGTGGMWLGATTYAIGDGSSRKNTPGSRRQIISATQTVEAHDATTGKFLQTVILKVDVNSGPSSFRQPVPGGKPPFIIKRIPKIDQPTFAVLNPLAVRGGGPNIPLGGTPNTNQIDNIVGPFYGIDTTQPTGDDLEAYVNGNNAYTSTTDIPVSGALAGDKHAKRFRQVTTATTDIPHGSIGNNSNPATQRAAGFQSDRTMGDQLVATTAFGNYAFDVADRSALGLNGGQISNVTVQTAPAEWNDNTNSYAGPGAVVNPLPWDDTPTGARAGSNSSVDYPNIGKQRVAHTLYGTASSGVSLSDNGGTLDATIAPAGTAPADRKVQPDSVEVEVSVPKYQPANLQLYDQTPGAAAGRIAPSKLTSSAQTVYPMGYVARETVYVDSNHNHRRDDGEAFRTFRVITGVPVDMTMTMASPTIDLGKLPQTFGVQTEAATPLGAFMPFQATTALSAAGAGYQKYFQQIIAHNEGNINLLNVHFDQKLRRYTVATGGGYANTDIALPFGSDALDAQATLNAFDLNGVTGPTTNIDPRKYILRTSLDSDLAAYNRNPGIVASANPNAYPGATFHKARVSDANPTALTVPDVPHDNAGPYSLPVGSALTKPTFGPPAIDATTNLPTSYGMPYIGLAVPLGTPVGNYAQDVRLFEGIDPTSVLYPDVQASGSTLYKPLFPPVYGGVVVDGTTTPAGLIDTLTTIGSAVTQPYSNPVRVRASIVETRVTDGATYGNLPQFDAPLLNTNGAADFLPVAFRNTFWSGGTASGNSALNLYWTSSRNSTANVPYALIGAHAPFSVSTTTPKYGYFQADISTGRWYDPIASLAAPATGSVNTAISTVPDQHLFSNGGNGGTSSVSSGSFSSDGTAYAFVQNVVAGGGTTAYQNNLYCYQIDPATGSTTGIAVPVSTDTRQPKFGARGLKFSAANVSFKDALDRATSINDNLWAFWNGGTRGRSTLFYTSALSANVNSYSAATATTTFTAFAQALPTPPGLSAVADPTAVLTYTTLPNNATVPAIDVTYSGTNADGNTDVYVSRYLPYFVRRATSTMAAPLLQADANGKSVVALALTPSPAITEQLLPDTARQFYQARDVAWVRADTLDVQVNNVSLLQDTTKTKNADGSYPLYAGIRTSYDNATGTVVYTNIPNDSASGRNLFPASNGKVSVTAIYADLVRGRVRFGTSYTGTGAGTMTFTRVGVPLPDGLLIAAAFQPQARRITTDRRADTEPVSFIDEAFKPNEANFYNDSLRAQGPLPTNASADVARVSTARYWFIWRKSAAPGTTTTPTLYTKTQRLTVYLHGPNNNPVPIQLNATTRQPIVTVTDNTTGTTLYDSAAPASAQVDVDWARGRLYFPLRDITGHALEGDKVSVAFTYGYDAQGKPLTNTVNDNIHWLDELRYNDPAAQPTAGDPSTTVDTNEHAVPIDVAINEGSPSAFLDPFAYADAYSGAYNPFDSTTAASLVPKDQQPHKVWLFWNSTRSGTADVFYETIDPRFSANP